MFMSVDLPEPEGPVMATNSPGSHGERHVVQDVRQAGIAFEDAVDVADVDHGAGVHRIYGARGHHITAIPPPTAPPLSMEPSAPMLPPAITRTSPVGERGGGHVGDFGSDAASSGFPTTAKSSFFGQDLDVDPLHPLCVSGSVWAVDVIARAVIGEQRRSWGTITTLSICCCGEGDPPPSCRA